MKKRLIQLFVFGLTMSQASFASALYCSGKVNDFYIDSIGNVTIYSTWRNEWTTVCNLKGSRNGIDTTTCALWAAMAQKNVSQPTLTTLVMFPELPASVTCANYATYGSAPPVTYYRLIGG